MPKPTIKSLQDEIKTLRELREFDAISVENVRQQLFAAQGHVHDLEIKCEEFRRDKLWLQSTVSSLIQAIKVGE